MKKTVLLPLIAGVVILAAGSLIFLTRQKKQNTPTTAVDITRPSSDNFQRMGQYSFGVDVCNEMTKEAVGTVLNKTVSKIRDYSNNMSTGCEYYIQGEHFVIVDVGYSDMEKQRKGLQILERRLAEEPRIELPNFLSYSDRGLIDVYMNVSEGQKFVRIGRSSTTATTEEDLINLAIAVEKKIKSFK